MPPFVLVDGSYFLFRAFHALPPLMTSAGLHTNAVRGAINAIQKLIKRVQPTHMAVIFDTPEPTFRHVLSPEYKGNRPSMPDELAEQIPYLHALIQALGIPLFKLVGAEADDIIGTLTKRAVAEGMQVLISTGDKDMAQLVCEQVTLEDSFKEKTMDIAGVIEKFGVRPEQIVDYLTLMGDAVDGIAGVAGVGGKTAAKLLNQYDNLENIIANASNIKGKIGENIANSLEQIKLDHQLATIICDLPLELDWHDLKLSAPNVNELQRLYTELEFRNDLKSLNHPNNPDNPKYQDNPTQSKTAPNIIANENATAEKQQTSTKYHTIFKQDEFNDILNKIATTEYITIDTETTALDYLKAELVGISLTFDGQDCYYIPLAHDYPNAPQQLNRDDILQQLKPYLENAKIKKIGHHLKYDQHIFKRYDIDLNGCYFDTMLASYVLNSVATRHNMDDVARLYLGYITTSFEDIAGKGAKQKTFNQIEIDIASRYACEDVDVTYRLYQVLSEKLAESPELLNILLQVEIPTSNILMHMEERGILLNDSFLGDLSDEFSKHIQQLEQQAHEIAGEAFNIGSPKQVGEILFEKLQLKGGKKTATGQYSTSESILEKIDHPIIEPILNYRSLTKLKSTYTDGLKERMQSSKRVHTNYHQAVTATGRLSSSDPNLQNIPIRDEIGRQIRQAFIAPEGHVLLAADYSQIELRLMAHFSQDEALVDAFNQGQDIHRRTASEVLNIPLDEVTSDQRRQAKAVNFGLLYGMSEFGLIRQLGFTREESQNYIKQYFQRYPAIYDYMQRTRQLASEQGFVETILGRRLYTPDIHAQNMMVRKSAERAAINAPLQGSAADIIKLAMIAVEQQLNPAHARLLLQVHDELVFEVKQEYADEVAQQIKQLMENVYTLNVPLEVEVGQGQNWEQAH
ncbi:DNA polymerase I [Moraxella sp. ZY210820]|uniref:DNA polymerase I n=1 Tax=Moraxella sp. ZY210820 TaxID=2904123 RepID=UPI002731A93F|nr:DNA polymerase I [Moraxella sp. ZY210820]WLF85121.1 DNA polymerase I [Moraxella sp. ZY210820]